MGENNLVWQQFCTNISYNDLKPRFQTRYQINKDINFSIELSAIR